MVLFNQNNITQAKTQPVQKVKKKVGPNAYMVDAPPAETEPAKPPPSGVPNIPAAQMEQEGTTTAMAGSDLTAAPPPPKDDRSVEQMVEDLVRNRLAGADNIDTSQEDALIRELMQQDIGGGRVGNRAAMGARGFAESGAALAMGADIERAARQSAIEQMLGVRQREEDQAWREAMDAAGVNVDYERLGIDEMEADARLQLLEALLRGDDGGAAAAPPATDTGNGGGNPWTSAGQAALGVVDPQGESTLATTAPGAEPAEAASTPEVSSIPKDYDETKKYVDEDGNTWMMYHTPNGWVKYQMSYSMPSQ